MSNLTPSQILLQDPLSKETRAERRTLLGASAIGIVIVKTGLVPSKISALGIDFNQTDQRSLLQAVAAVVVYFLVAFLIYASSDFLVWRIAHREAIRLRLAERERQNPDEYKLKNTVDDEMRKRFPRSYLIFGFSNVVSILRAFLEFGLPIMIAIYAAILLLRARV